MNNVYVSFSTNQGETYGQEYLCEEGATFSEELNETLDSASIVIKGLSARLDLQPLDYVKFRIDGQFPIFTKIMLLNSFQESITRQVNNRLYNYSITLISETKRLEGIVLPNLCITNDAELSVYDYIKRYNELYGKFSISVDDFSGAVEKSQETKIISINSSGVVSGDTNLCTYKIKKRYAFENYYRVELSLDENTGIITCSKDNTQHTVNSGGVGNGHYPATNPLFNYLISYDNAQGKYYMSIVWLSNNNYNLFDANNTKNYASAKYLPKHDTIKVVYSDGSLYVSSPETQQAQEIVVSGVGDYNIVINNITYGVAKMRLDLNIGLVFAGVDWKDEPTGTTEKLIDNNFIDGVAVAYFSAITGDTTYELIDIVWQNSYTKDGLTYIAKVDHQGKRAMIYVADIVRVDFGKKCHNMQWNAPTLREVLNDLCLICDCIITLQNGALKPLNISQKRTPFTSNNITYINRSQSLEDYSSETQIELTNSIDKQESKIVEGVGWRNSTVPYFSSALSNLKVETNRPIYDIKSFKVIVPIDYTDTDLEETIKDIYEVDMTEYVKEYGVYSSLKTGYGSSNYESNLKINCIYYNRGSNDIEGFDFSIQASILGNKSTTLIKWMHIIANKLHIYSSFVEGSDINNWKFKIEYTSISNQTYRISRGTDYKRIRNNRVVVDSQANSSVDVDRFVAFEKDKLDRLSNKVLLIQDSQVQYLNSVATLGQVFDNEYIIFSRNIVIGRRCLNCEYYASKDFVLANYFTSINSQKRNFERIDNATSTIRHEVRKIYYELSFNANSQSIATNGYVLLNDTDTQYLRNGVSNELFLKYYGWSPLLDLRTIKGNNNDDARNIKFATGYSSSDEDLYRNLILANGSLNVANNVVSYNFDLNDNVFAGYSVSWHNINTFKDYPATAFYNNGVNYNRGAFNTFNVLGVKLGGHNRIDEFRLSGDVDNFKKYSNLLPIHALDDLSREGSALSLVIPMYKDNAEKLGLCVNFEWVSDTPEIEILDNIAMNSLFNTSDKPLATTLTAQITPSLSSVACKNVKAYNSQGALLSGTAGFIENGVLNITSLNNNVAYVIINDSIKVNRANAKIYLKISDSYL